MIFARYRRKGFSVIEMSVATGLLALLSLIISESWHGLGKATVDLIVRAQIAQEMDFVAAALSRDLGGFATDSTTPTTPINTITIATPPGTTDSNSICWQLDNGDTITYQLASSDQDAWKHNNLVRIYYSKFNKVTTRFNVARNVDTFQATWNPDGPVLTLTLTITFSCNYLPPDPTASDAHTKPIIKRTCVFVTYMPSPKQL